MCDIDLLSICFYHQYDTFPLLLEPMKQQLDAFTIGSLHKQLEAIKVDLLGNTHAQIPNAKYTANNGYLYFC